MKRWWCAAFAAIISCGGTDADGPSDDSTEGVCGFYAEKYCAAEEHCWPGFEGYWNDRATCQKGAKLGCVSRLSAPGVNNTSSRVVACANALSALSCVQYNDDERWPETCTPPPGQLADGAPCVVNGQCQGGVCPLRTGVACGVCETASPLGGACDSALICRGTLLCVNGICAAHPRIGETCDYMDRYCVYGAVCKNLDATGVGTCAAATPTGGRCNPTSSERECDIYEDCDEVSGTCKSLGVSVPVGAKCFEGSCNASGYCGSDGICKANPGVGEACIPGQSHCQSPARCLASTCKLPDAAVCK